MMYSHMIISALAHITLEKFDATAMHMMPEIAAQERMVDNGTGQVEVSVTMYSDFNLSHTAGLVVWQYQKVWLCVILSVQHFGTKSNILTFGL